jgi:hypothetical protein
MIGEFTLQQLKDGCRVGMLDSWGTTRYFPDYESTFLEQKDELEYVIIRPRDYASIDAKFLHIKRPEIKTLGKYNIPYSTRLINLCGEDIFAIQQLDFDFMTTKVVGNYDEVENIRGFIKERNTFDGLDDNEMWEVHYKELEQYRDIPTLSNHKMSNIVKGNFNPTPERFDRQGLHITDVDDYDNYSYLLYGVSHQEYTDIRYRYLQEKRNEDRAIYFEEKLDDWKQSIQDNASRIVKVLQEHPEFIDKIKNYGHKDGQLLSDKNIITDACKECKISWKAGWATWKFLNIDDLEYFIINKEYLEPNNDAPNLFR